MEGLAKGVGRHGQGLINIYVLTEITRMEEIMQALNTLCMIGELDNEVLLEQVSEIEVILERIRKNAT